MYNKLMYAKIGILGLVLLKHEKITYWINNNIDYIFDMYSDVPLIAWL